MKVTINVTQEHIDAGIRQTARHCPIAIAICAACGQFASVTPHEFRFLYGRSEYIALPKNVGKTVTKYDATGAMSPFSFELDLPENSVQKTEEV